MTCSQWIRITARTNYKYFSLLEQVEADRDLKQKWTVNSHKERVFGEDFRHILYTL